MKTIFTVSILICLCFCVNIAWGKTIYVDDDNTEGPWDGTPEHPYHYIQDGIDAAVDGDIVQAADGEYKGAKNKNLDFSHGLPEGQTRAIIVKSEYGPDNCIIDCEGDGRGFYFHSGETEESVVSGFTIKNGLVGDEEGGGIRCENYSSPIIERNIITGNSAIRGGGISCRDSPLVTIQNNKISGNSAKYYGGGIYCNSSSPTIQNNEIIGNSSEESKGGGISCNNCPSVTIQNNEIRDNSANNSGGGIYCRDCPSAMIQNNQIIGNSAKYDGGGISCNYSDLRIQNNVITNNVAQLLPISEGGGILCANSSPEIFNNTISGNSAGSGGGIYCDDYPSEVCSPTVLNTILWGNKPNEIYIRGLSSIDITYSNIQGGWEGEGNIDVSPLFVDPDNGDYSLDDGSCGIGAGIMAEDVPITDIEGNPRPNPDGSKPDIGAYENPNGEPQSDYGTVYGTVVNTLTGEAVSEAKVSAYPGDYVTHTDKDGYYIFDELSPGDYKITVSSADYYCESTSGIKVTTCESKIVDFGLTRIITPWLEGGNWIELDGDDDYAEAADSTSLDVGDEDGEDLTIEAWVYPRRFPSVDISADEEISAVIASKPGAYELFIIRWFEEPYLPGFEFRVHFGEEYRFIMSTSTEFKIETWYHIAGVFDNSADTIALYVNGEQKASDSFTDNLNNSPEPFIVGGPPTLSGDEFFDGCIDEVRVSDVARYSDDFMPLSEPFTSDGNTRALWHFDEPICSISFEDSSGNGNTLTGSNGARSEGELSIGDVSGNGYVTAYDAPLVLQYVVGLDTLCGAQQKRAADVTGNCGVTALDAALILQYCVGLITEFPGEQPNIAPALHAKSEDEYLIEAIEQLESVSLNKEQRKVLEQLKHLVKQELLPAYTILLQNYPNPFNPETWIPYQLATDSPVTIRIYNIKGQLIRTLHLGTQLAGSYVTKDRAAHWNGRNNIGQKVSSGLYFYIIQAGNFTATKRMILVK